jgi:tagatose-1,6-bisphosphate aldolase non-catalytic subunit AgaZ/GatZ
VRRKEEEGQRGGDTLGREYWKRRRAASSLAVAVVVDPCESLHLVAVDYTDVDVDVAGAGAVDAAVVVDDVVAVAVAGAGAVAAVGAVGDHRTSSLR